MEPITQDLDNAAIHAIAAKYGPYLEKLTDSQKLDVMGCLALWVASAIDEDEDAVEVHWSEISGLEPDGTVEDLLNQCDDLAPDEALVFIISIANTVTM
jgi:hypothetical protein